MSMLLSVSLSAALSLIACKGDDPVSKSPEPFDMPDIVGNEPFVPPVPEVCDAGLDVWVQRVFPLMLGRKPHGAGEVGMWVQFARDQGKAAAIRALSTSPEYRQWWKINLSDMLYVARNGYGEDSACFEYPAMNTHDGSLAQWIRSEQPDVGQFPANFNMADVLVDGLVADDISVIYQANLFARTNYSSACANFDPKTIETERRIYHGDQLLEVYVDRNLDCMSCHNSEFSVTDSLDPALDRAWGRGPLFERALFGDSAGPIDEDEYYAMSRFYGVVQDLYYFSPGTYNMNPWGMDASCGSFARFPPDYDFLDQETAYFGGLYDNQGSLWDIERLFDAGVNGMSGESLAFESAEDIEPSTAFAYLTGQHFVDQIWRMAFGNRLLLPYGMARNSDQAVRLQALTDKFVTNGWSLAELLVDITSDPYFNAGLPSTCNTEPYGMAPVIDPYSVVNEGEAANNGPGDLVHRFTARTLLRSLYVSLEFGPAPEYFGFGSLFGFGAPEEELQRALGVFHSDASPGFNGVDFQGVLTWEGQFYSCANPDGGSAGFLRTLYDTALSRNETVEATVLSLKDRLTARGLFEDETERALVEDLVGYPLSTPISETDAATFGRNLSLLCGVLTTSPEFMLSTEPRSSGPLPLLAFDIEEDCDNLALMAEMTGITVTCSGGLPLSEP